MTPQQFYEISNKAISNFHGNGRVLESALGALINGRPIYWLETVAINAWR